MDWVGGVDTYLGRGIFPTVGRVGQVGTQVNYHYGMVRIGRYPG